MGQIVYCYQCQSRLTDADFQRGLAIRLDDKFCCTKCRPAEAAPPETPASRVTRARPAAETTRRTKTVSTARLTPAPPPTGSGDPARKKNRTLAFCLGGGGLLLLVGLMALLLTGRKEPAGRGTTDSGEEKPKVAETAPSAVGTHEERAMAALEKAHEYAKAKPDDLPGRIERLKEVVWGPGFERTPAADLAQKEMAVLKGKLAEAMVPALAKLDGEIRGPVEREEFKAAFDLLEAAKGRVADPAWGLEVAKKIRELRDAAKERLGVLVEKARGEAGGAKAIREQVAKWGLEWALADFDKAAGAAAEPAAATPVKKERTEEGRAYLGRWQVAIEKAYRREYAAAIVDLENHKKALKEADSKGEQAQDVKDLKAVEGLHKEGRDALSKLVAGRKVSLVVIEPSGRAQTVAGELASVTPERVEVRREKQKETTFVEPSEVAAASLVDQANARGAKKDAARARASAIFCLLDGDPEGAKRHLGADPATLPEKYLEAAKEARGKAAPANAVDAQTERAAKQLFWGGGRDWGDFETLGGAIEKYKLLLADYGQRSVVVKNKELIQKRSEAGKDYPLFAGDLRGTGSFKLSKNEKVESCWASSADGDEARTLENYVEAAFHALAGQEYRAWAYAGACCKEKFLFYYQATEMKMQGKEIEPGTTSAWPLESRLPGLKKDHASHKPGEKDPFTWGWISLPLPRYAAAGPKKIRLCSVQKGFSLAHFFVSSTRRAAPAEADVAEERKSDADRPGRKPGRDLTLVAHFTFEAGSGTSAEDVSGQGNDATVKGGAKWAKLAGAPGDGTSIQFDGKDDAVTVAHSAGVDPASGSFTLSLWLAAGADTPLRLANKWDGKVGWMLDVNSGKGGADKNGGKLRVKLNDGRSDFDEAYPAGINTQGKTWQHVAWVVDRAAGELRLYVNGKSVGQGSIKNIVGGLSNTAPVTLGTMSGAKPDKFFKGHLDEVRLYSRALAPADVLALFAQR